MQLSATTPASLAASTPTPTARPVITAGAPEQVGRQLVGMSIADARAAVEALGMPIRVTVEDGEPQIVTMDWNPNRINVGIEGQEITSFEGLG